MRLRPTSSTLASTAHGSSATALVLDGPPSPDMLRWLCAPFVALAILLMSMDIAEAKRLGGGSSFGSKNSYSKSYDKPTPPSQGAPNMERQAMPKQQPNAAGGGFFSKFGGIGGMLGGLLVGGMLGSLLFGGMGGGFGMLEILLLGVGGYMLFRYMRSRRASQADQASTVEQASPLGGERFAYAGAANDPTAAATNIDGFGGLHSAPGGQHEAAQHKAPVLPAGIDEAEFLAGAKALYARLQTSWDRRDLADIKSFTSPEVHAEISRQAQADPAPGKTEILTVQAQVVEAATSGSQTVLSVLYDVFLRENPADSAATQVREIWHIRRDDSVAHPTWILEGIQQVAL